MFLKLYKTVRDFGIPASPREYLDLLDGLSKEVCETDIDSFYFFSRSCLVKDEKYFDRFDKAFSFYFKDIKNVENFILKSIPDNWLKNELNKILSEKEKNNIKPLSNLDEIIEGLKKRMEEQKKRHQWGNKWIGTGGTSPYGNSGYNPAGIRIGGSGGGRRAVKVWEKREYKNFDDNITIGIRDIKIALRRLRKFARSGSPTEFDLDKTINATADNGGYLDVRMRPERKNRLRVLLLLDVGGSMDEYSKICEELFSAARNEFKSLNYFYFHNFIYEGLWKDNIRRGNSTTSIYEIIRTFNKETRVIFVGDALMSPYEITYPGGSIEHWNKEPGSVWMKRICSYFSKLVWLNPENREEWDYSQSNMIVRELVDNRMFSMNIKGIESAMKELAR